MNEHFNDIKALQLKRVSIKIFKGKKEAGICFLFHIMVTI